MQAGAQNDTFDAVVALVGSHDDTPIVLVNAHDFVPQQKAAAEFLDVGAERSGHFREVTDRGVWGVQAGDPTHVRLDFR